MDKNLVNETQPDLLIQARHLHPKERILPHNIPLSNPTTLQDTAPTDESQTIDLHLIAEAHVGLWNRTLGVIKSIQPHKNPIPS